MKSALLLGPDAAKRIFDAIGRIERETNSSRGQTRNGKTDAVWAFVKPTNAGSPIGGYPGVLLLPTESLNLFDSDANSEQVWIYSSDATTQLLIGYPHIARLSGWDVTRAKSTWQALPYCCPAVSGGGPSEPPPTCYACTNAPPCLAVTLGDGWGWVGTVYVPLVSNGNGACQYQGTARTPNAILTLSLWIGAAPPGMFGSSITGWSGATVTAQNPNWILDVGDAQYWRTCPAGAIAWSGSGSFPFGDLQVAHGGLTGTGPVIIDAQPGTDAALCAGGGGIGGGTGGTGGNGGGGAVCQPCDPAVDSPCYNCQDGLFCSNPEACFKGGGGGVGFGGLKSSCSCGGSCADCAGVPAQMPADPLTTIALVGYTNTLATATVKPLFQSTTDVGNVGTGEDDLHSFTLAGNEISRDGDGLEFAFAFVIAASATATIRLYLGGVKYYDSGGVVAGATPITLTARLKLVRKTSTTARAMLEITNTAGGASTVTASYISETTLTGITFSSALIAKSTGQATNNNDVTAVLSQGQKIPSSATLTLAGVTTVQVLSYGTDDILSIPQDAAGYAGTSAGQLSVGVSTGAVDVDIYVSRTATTTKGQIVRLFKDVSGTKAPAGSFEIPAVTASADNPDFSKEIYLKTLRVNGTTEKIYISKENNEGLFARGVRKNYFAA